MIRSQRTKQFFVTIALVAAGLLSLGLTGCENKNSDSKDEEKAESKEAEKTDKEKESEQKQAGVEHDPFSDMSKKEMVQRLEELAPARGYLQAHRGVKKPMELLGGPIEVGVTQEEGGVFVALPDQRELDPRVLGPPEAPRAYGGTPGMTGVPPAFRNVEDGKYTNLKKKTPFGDKHIVMPKGKLQLKATDATATDAANTDDSVKMKATWEDKEGNSYQVLCCEKLATAGLEYPTFGGVVTNHLMHGFSGVGTPLMPTMFTYLGFWGMGEVKKNGETLQKPRLVHGMLTEYARGEDYKLVHDDGVTPGRRHFHLMVAPFKPNMKEKTFEHANVDTGFKLPNGKTLPFWHVMFETLDIESNRGG